MRTRLLVVLMGAILAIGCEEELDDDTIREESSDLSDDQKRDIIRVFEEDLGESSEYEEDPEVSNEYEEDSEVSNEYEEDPEEPNAYGAVEYGPVDDCDDRIDEYSQGANWEASGASMFFFGPLINAVQECDDSDD